MVYKSDGTSPIAQVAVLLYSAADAFIAQTTSADDGTYRFEGLPAGGYKIWAIPPAEFLPAFYDGDQTFATAALVSVPANGAPIAIAHRLVRWGTISGAVRQEAVNAPIPFAKIDVWTVDGAWVSSEIADREGGYSVARLAPGSYRVTASAPGYHPAFHVRRVEAGANTVASQTVAIQTVVVEEGRTTALTDMLLAPEDSAVLMGDATGDEEVTIADFSVLAASFGTSEGQVGFFAAADFDGDGSIGIGDFSILAERFGEGTTP
ncbi:MAG: carboxypeptidase regulatory-like domain-containing protein [Chloroflexi bacterium]|nr:carboxypeptidase regulatory-like domain-containing protein [Chloroflexota bacterium]